MDPNGYLENAKRLACLFGDKFVEELETKHSQVANVCEELVKKSAANIGAEVWK